MNTASVLGDIGNVSVLSVSDIDVDDPDDGKLAGVDDDAGDEFGGRDTSSLPSTTLLYDGSAT